MSPVNAVCLCKLFSPEEEEGKKSADLSVYFQFTKRKTMAFSQSFSMGNSTFLNIEKNALDNNGLETIEESPKDNARKQDKTRNFSIRRKQKFQRCKSDSVLQESKKGLCFIINFIIYHIKRHKAQNFYHKSRELP